MGLLDSIRRAEEQGRSVARSTLQRAGAAWDDAERRIRRKMRLHPPASPRNRKSPGNEAESPISTADATSPSSATADEFTKPAA